MYDLQSKPFWWSVKTVMAELCLGSTPLHRLWRPSVNVVLIKPIVNAGMRTSECRKTPRRLGVVVKGGLDQLLAEPLALIEGGEAWLEEVHAGGSEVRFGRIEC
jgi:hypothetical protein